MHKRVICAQPTLAMTARVALVIGVRNLARSGTITHRGNASCGDGSMIRLRGGAGGEPVCQRAELATESSPLI